MMQQQNSRLPRIGYASMNMDVSPNKYRTCRKENISDEVLHTLIKHNLMVLEKTIDYNIKHHNEMFRISSSLIPFGSSLLNTLDWAKEFEDDFKRIKNKIDTHKIRVSMHPGQYTVLNSPNPEVVKNAILDLNYHAKVLQLLTDCKDACIILHVGGVYDDKQKAMNRFILNYKNLLDDLVKKYLVIENDDRLYTVEDCLAISKETQIPVVFDNLHHEINPSDKELSFLLDEVLFTWKSKKPKFHYSQQALNKRTGAHSESINLERFILDYLDIYKDLEVDIMLEVKDKNRSFMKVNLYFHPSQKVLEQEWARYKYKVMSKSQKSYNDLRKLFKDNQSVDVREFYQVVDKVESHNISAEMNAFQHVWGYFKKLASSREKDVYLSLFEEKDYKGMYRHLKKMNEKYKVSYLQNSYYFKED